MSIKRDTYHRVKARKRGGETFDELLARLVADDANA